MKPKRNGSRIPIDYEKVRVLALLNPSNDELAWALGIFSGYTASPQTGL